MTSKTIVRVGILGATLLAGCQGLDVVNTNEPDRERALTRPADIETLIASSWRNLWTRWHGGSSSYNVLPLVADVMSGTYANDAALVLSSEPRLILDNHPLSEAHTVTRSNWETFYVAISSSNDGLAAIKGGLRMVIDDVDHTTRDWTFAKWTQGLAYGYLSMLYDKGLWGTEDHIEEDPFSLPIIESEAMRDSAIMLLKMARDTMQSVSFTLPDTWINGNAMTSAEMARLTNAYIARFYIYGARTPEERKNLPWQMILNDYLNNSITANHQVSLASGTLTSSFLSRFQQTGSFSAWADYKLIGPADVAGEYQRWLNTPVTDRTRILVTTPDRRITRTADQAGCAAASSLPSSSLCHGAYFRFRPDNIFRPERGTYHHSHYQWIRNDGRSVSQTWLVVTVDEMNLMKAEANFFLGNLATAAQLINTTRTRPPRRNGSGSSVNFGLGLPPVTAAGVTPATDCVPRKADGTCGSLYDALMYERMLETMMYDAYQGYLDSRGFGRLPTGTFLELPIPGRELMTLGLPIYTFGGPGGQSSAQ